MILLRFLGETGAWQPTGREKGDSKPHKCKLSVGGEMSETKKTL